MLQALKRLYLGKKLGEPIVVVSGLPRSGTSMMMKMLEAGGMTLLVDHIREADEDNPKGYYELERVKQLLKDEDKSWLGEGKGRAVKIVSTLLMTLPDTYFYKVIFMHRHLKEVIASQNKMLQRRSEPVDESGDQRMQGLFEKNLAKTKHWLDGQSNFEVINVQYHEVVANPRGQAQRVRDFLGLELDLERMAGAVSPELYRNRS